MKKKGVKIKEIAELYKRDKPYTFLTTKKDKWDRDTLDELIDIYGDLFEFDTAVKSREVRIARLSNTTATGKKTSPVKKKSTTKKNNIFDNDDMNYDEESFDEKI